MKTFTHLAFALVSVQAAAGPLKVVTTTEDLASIARSVGGKHATVTSLVVGARDPHRIEAKPSFMARVASADLFIAVGLDLEIGYESAILSGSRNAKVRIGAPGHLYPHEGVSVLERPREGVSRADGDVHPFGNPHYWLDPYNGRLIARNIAERMAKLQPASAAEFKANAAAFVRDLDERMFGSALVAKFGGDSLWQWDGSGQLETNLKGAKPAGWEGLMASVRGKPIVTYHRTFTYFAWRFNLRVIEELEPKPGLEPSPGHLAEVVRASKAAGVKAILFEPYKPERPAQFVASRIGGKAVAAPTSVGQMPGAKTYLDMLDVLIERVVEAAGG